MATPDIALQPAAGAALPRHQVVSPERRRYRLITAERGSAMRLEIEAFVAQRFHQAYGARIHSFLPVLVALIDGPGKLVGAAGFAAAGAGPLFIERYLNQPIEAAFAAQTKRAVPRGSIVEIGNLAARGPGGGRYVACAITRLLTTLGFEWGVFTATVQVRNAIAKCGLSGYDFGPADGRAMGEELPAWGSYYDHDPRLMGGSICHADATFAKQGRAQRPRR